MIRKAVKQLILSEKKSVKASADNLADYLGVPKYRYGEVEDKLLFFGQADVGVTSKRRRCETRNRKGTVQRRASTQISPAQTASFEDEVASQKNSDFPAR